MTSHYFNNARTTHINYLYPDERFSPDPIIYISSYPGYFLTYSANYTIYNNSHILLSGIGYNPSTLNPSDFLLLYSQNYYLNVPSNK